MEDQSLQVGGRVNVLITGASGYLGALLVFKLSEEKEKLGINSIVATDVRELTDIPKNIIFEKLDVRDNSAIILFEKHSINCVIHLASIVNPGKKSSRDFEYSVDVEGTKNILNACLKTKVKRIIISSSGAAYGYHPENKKILKETDPVRGNYEFAYSYHKRLVEEELSRYRNDHPELEQVIFRISTILGENVNNLITDLFKKPIQIGVWGTDSRFSIIWDMDAVEAFKQAIFSPKPGVYNLSGDGSVTIEERGKMMNKYVLSIPSQIIACALFILKRLGLTQYGPEQTRFLKYRPVLDNSKLKNEFGFIPKKTSRQNFEEFASRL